MFNVRRGEILWKEERAEQRKGDGGAHEEFALLGQSD